jgi:integrase
MAALYVHKKRGFQIRFRLYFPDGTDSVKYRYAQTKTSADLLLRECEYLENRSRSCSLAHHEVVQARHSGILSEDECRIITGGKLVTAYDLVRVLAAYDNTIKVSHTPISFKKASKKAALLGVWLQTHPIPSLTDADVKQYIIDRRSGTIAFMNPRSKFARVGVKSKTIKNEVDILKGIVDEAVSLGMVTSNTVRSVSVPTKTSRLRRSLNRDEVQRLVDAIGVHRHLLHGQICEFVLVALYTGYRLSELRTLTWDDINLETRHIYVQSKDIEGEDSFNAKSGEARFKSIADALYPVLDNMERRGRFVFGGDAPYLAEVLSAAVKKVMSRAGLPSDLSLHHLRHTYGSWLLRMTGDLKYVQNEMGHLTIATTQNYMHAIDDSSDPARSFDYT